MVLLSLANLRIMEQLEELSSEMAKPPFFALHQELPERQADRCQPIPTVSECLEMVQLARGSLLSQIGEAVRRRARKPEGTRALVRQAAEVSDVLDHAAFVFLGFVLGAHQMRTKVLPRFRATLSRGKRTSAANMLGLAQSSLAEMLHSVESLQRRYTATADEVGGLTDVAQKASRSGALSGQLPPAASLFALLVEVQARLAALERRTQRLRGALLTHSRSAGLPPDCEGVCEALEELCDRCHEGCRA